MRPANAENSGEANLARSSSTLDPRNSSTRCAVGPTASAIWCLRIFICPPKCRVLSAAFSIGALTFAASAVRVFTLNAPEATAEVNAAAPRVPKNFPASAPALGESPALMNSCIWVTTAMRALRGSSPALENFENARRSPATVLSEDTPALSRFASRSAERAASKPNRFSVGAPLSSADTSDPMVTPVRCDAAKSCSRTSAWSFPATPNAVRALVVSGMESCSPVILEMSRNRFAISFNGAPVRSRRWLTWVTAAPMSAKELGTSSAIAFAVPTSLSSDAPDLPVPTRIRSLRCSMASPAPRNASPSFFSPSRATRPPTAFLIADRASTPTSRMWPISCSALFAPPPTPVAMASPVAFAFAFAPFRASSIWRFSAGAKFAEEGRMST